MSVGALIRNNLDASLTFRIPRSVFTPRVPPSRPASVQNVMLRARMNLLVVGWYLSFAANFCQLDHLFPLVALGLQVCGEFLRRARDAFGPVERQPRSDFRPLHGLDEFPVQALDDGLGRAAGREHA